MEVVLKSSGSDQEMVSQTETEDTDTGEVSSEGTSQDGSSSYSTETTSTSSTSTTDSSSADILMNDDQNVAKPINVSVDLTDVTELDDNELASGNCSSNDEIHRQASAGKTGNKKIGMINIDFSSDWYNHSCFSKYWQHYSEVMSWCKMHTSVCQKLTKSSAKSQTSSIPFPQRLQPHSMNIPAWNHPYINQQKVNENSDKESSKRRRRRRKQKQRRNQSFSSSEVTSSETQTETSEEFQMEITQDMIDFFAKTQAHRKERDEAKKAEKEEENNESDHINVEDVKVTEVRKPTTKAPTERPGAKRTAEMKLLYGKGAAMIHGMETALQMAYDRNIDLKQPKIWPNMPLRVVFA